MVRWLLIHTLDAHLDQIAGDIGLDVGEPDHEVGLQIEDLLDTSAGETGDAWLVATGLGWADGELGDPDDAILLAEGIEDLGRLLGEADDSLRVAAHSSVTVTLLITMSSWGRSEASVPEVAIESTASRPERTCPKIV